MAPSRIADRKRLLASLIPLMEAGGCAADALYIETATLSVNKDTTSTDVVRHTDQGVKLRVFDGRRYHERGVSGWRPRALRKAARELGAAKRRAGIELDLSQEPLDADYTALGRIDPATVPLKEKLARVKGLHRRLLRPGMVNARIYYDESRETRIFVSATRRLSQEISGCLFITIPFVTSRKGDIRYHYKSFFGHGWERSRIPAKELDAVARFAARVAKATKLRPGKYRCLLTPAMAGLLAHESFGHGMEADTIYKGRAKAAQFLGKRIAPAKVSIADGPLIPGSHGFFFFDDEGMTATKTLMVDKGVVNLPLTDAYNAARLGVPRSSNGRCESFDRKVYARMTNTYFAPGTASKDAMLAQLKDGLILHESSGGMEDPKGWGIQIQGVIAERVRDGRPTGKLSYEIGMTGYLPRLLKDIIAVSKEFAVPGTGRCGKGHHDWVRVSEGGPWLLIREVQLS